MYGDHFTSSGGERKLEAATRRPFAGVPGDAIQHVAPMRDGELLATDVYLPSTGDRWPTLLSRLPYDKCGDESYMPAIARWFNEHSYAVVVQDVRGKVRSGGDFAPYEHEVDDGYDTIEWIINQSWCDGAIGMFGDSYFGYTQWAAAASGHPAVRAIAPRVTSADSTDLRQRQGLLRFEMNVLWALETCVDEALYDPPIAVDWMCRPAAVLVPRLLSGRRIRYLDESAIGASRVPPLPVSGDVPALHMSGWWDFLQPGQIKTWQRAASAGSAPQYLAIDSTDHGWNPLRSPGTPYVNPLTSESTMASFLDTYLGPLLPFFDDFVAGRSRYQAPPVTWKLTHVGWQQSSTWPPPEAEVTRLHPTATRSVPPAEADGFGITGGLATEPEEHERQLGWIHDPDTPVPSLSHPYHPLIDPVDEKPLSGRDDVLVFESVELDDHLDLAGPASLDVHLSSSARSAHLMAIVSVVAEDGTTLRVLDGATVLHGPWPAHATIDLGHAGYRVRTKHRLRLTISASQFPEYVLHPGNETNPWTSDTFTTNELRIAVGGPRGIVLSLSSLPGKRAS